MIYPFMDTQNGKSMASMTENSNHICVSVFECECPSDSGLMDQRVQSEETHSFLPSSWLFKLPHLHYMVSLCGHALLCPEPINLSQYRCTRRPCREEPCPLHASSQCSKQARPRSTAIKWEFYRHHKAISVQLWHEAAL